jgi:hypothetical protein
MRLGSFFILLGTPLWIFLVQALVCRLSSFRGLPRQKMAVLCCLAGTILVCLSIKFLEGRGWGEQLADWIFVGMSALGLSHVYFHVFNMSETARRIRILTELKQDRKLGDEGESGYSATNMFRVRLERLVSLHQIRKEGDRYFALPTLLAWVATLFKAYERMLFPIRAQKRGPTEKAVGQPLEKSSNRLSS